MRDLDRPVLIDTSVWIQYFRKREEVYHKVNELIDSGRVYCLRLIIAELIQGAKTEREIEVIKDLTRVFPTLKEEPDSWEKAGILAFRMRKAGKSIGLSDCYIALLARQNNAAIYTFDKHFAEIQSYEDITLL
jgi:predicted nucleic acid-binding protein